ncbi:MAG: YIP1 family protein [Betaproteobacteria bacterium]
MADTLAPAAPGTDAPKGLLSRVVGVLTSPRATYAAVAARPRALAVFALVLAIVIGATAIFLSTDIGRQALIDQQVRSMESFGRQVTDAQYQRLEQMEPYAAYFSAAGQLIFLPLGALAVAGIAFAVFNAILGGDASFRQVFAIVAHSGVVLALQSIFTLPLDYARQSLSSPTNLAVFLPMLDENSFPARMLGSIDLFVIWWAVSLAIGFGVLYRRRTGPIATTMIALYVGIAIVIALVKAVASGA